MLKKTDCAPKYQNLITKAHYLPTSLAKAEYENKNTKADVELLTVRYSAVPDTAVELTDADYQAFYDKRKKFLRPSRYARY